MASFYSAYFSVTIFHSSFPKISYFLPHPGKILPVFTIVFWQISFPYDSTVIIEKYCFCSFDFVKLKSFPFFLYHIQIDLISGNYHITIINFPKEKCYLKINHIKRQIFSGQRSNSSCDHSPMVIESIWT